MGDKGKWATHPSERLRVRPGFAIEGFDHRSSPGWKGDEGDAVDEMKRRGQDLYDLQEKLFAEAKTAGGTRSVLLVLQGMDTAGKGGIVGHVVGMVNPYGTQVRAFGCPTEEERKHHYLWRIENSLPLPGRIGVFDRSHYEQVLVVRVENLEPPEEWGQHYDEINAFEEKVAASGTAIVKCALMVSPEEQLRRLKDRLDDPSKYWKYNPQDIDKRAAWDQYMEAYQDVFDRCSTDIAPWYAIPADHKWFARLAIAELLTSTLEGLAPQWPPADFDVAEEQTRIGALKG
ncbi:MAG: polyphosphate kinase 2 family protein [Demequinaceae bacterium]|nr:polyphosphate kinase 2 family protein [Demequinaceae bacterium]